MSRIYNRNVIIQVLLFATAFLIYLWNFPQVLLQPNSLLSGTSEDALKNYFTFQYHINYDRQLLHFSGMNYPFGEHVIYTDCQPLLSFILKLLPFGQNYLVGILHCLIFFSFMITPVILYRILQRLKVDDISSFFIALAVGLLSPQYFKVCLGHYALAYSFIIPLEILLLLAWFEERRHIQLILLVVFNLLLFLHHPYIGFSVSLFCLLSILIKGILNASVKAKVRTWLCAIVAGASPILLFTVFLGLTDTHPERAVQPYGVANWNLSFSGLFVPVYGPFKKLLETLLGQPPQHFEAYNYLGIFLILSAVVFMTALPFIWKKVSVGSGSLSLFLAALLLLFFAFGMHLWLMRVTGFQINALSQFRATGRFGWFFYYMLPLLLAGGIFSLVKQKSSLLVARIVAILLFAFNLVEAYYFFRVDENDHWKTRNFFDPARLSAREKELIDLIKSRKTQALLPLRFYHGGSEMYERQGIYTSMPAAIFYAYHSGLPIASSFLSRSSLRETEELINLLNPYKKNRMVLSGLTDAPFTVIKEKTELLPDELRISRKVRYIEKYDSLEIGFLTAYELITPDLGKDPLVLRYGNYKKPDSRNFVFVPNDDRKPFVPANMLDYEKFYELDSNLVETGDYAVSLHLLYKEKIHQSLGIHLIVTEAINGEYNWRYNFSMRVPSGLYDGFSVNEQRIHLLKGAKYEFMMKGFNDRSYMISNFMLRPEALTVIIVDQKGDSLINNFPR